MPNCDFYATRQDQEPLLSWIFSEGACRVFELASDVGEPLKEFHSASEVLAEFDRVYSNGAAWHTVHLQLYVNGASPPFVPRRIELDPKLCKGATFRHGAEGWGLVQLYLAAPTEQGLDNSHTNHNSQMRAQSWAPIIANKDATESWDFKKISAFSARLNRQIKKLSVAKIGSQSVLPGALALWDTGVLLGPFCQANATLQLKV